MLVQVHELRKDGDAQRLVRAAFDAAALNPAEKTVDNFVAVGGDHTANAGKDADSSRLAIANTCRVRSGRASDWYTEVLIIMSPEAAQDLTLPMQCSSPKCAQLLDTSCALLMTLQGEAICIPTLSVRCKCSGQCPCVVWSLRGLLHGPRTARAWPA